MAEREKADVVAEARVFLCPECRYEGKGPEDLGGHLERHRPVGKAEPNSVFCPKGCGRPFQKGYDKKRQRWDLREHLFLCDGKPPLSGKPLDGTPAAAAPPVAILETKEEETKMPKSPKPTYPCRKKCGRGFKFPSWERNHAETCDGSGRDHRIGPRKIPTINRLVASPAAAETEEKTPKEKTLDFLKSMKAIHQWRVDEIDLLIEAVEGVLEARV